MGANTLNSIIDGTDADATDIDQYLEALNGDLVPRTAGAPTANGGSAGTPAFPYKRANVSEGYFSVGMIIPFHTYGGVIPIPAGWYPCTNTLVNQTNYDAIRGVGKWAIEVVTSVLDGKYAPDMAGNYPVGAASTPATGVSSIPTVGNIGNQINIQHSHIVDSHVHNATHNHKWYESHGAAFIDDTWNSVGTLVVVPLLGVKSSAGKNHVNADSGTATGALGDAWTSNDLTNTGAASPSTDNQGSATQSIQPESTEVIYLIRII